MMIGTRKIRLLAILATVSALTFITPGTAHSFQPILLPGQVNIDVEIMPPHHDAQPVYHVRRALRPPTLDGKLDEWQDVQAMVVDRKQHHRGGIWRGPQDISGAMKMMWDENGLYFALTVTDDVTNPDPSPHSVWRNDSTQYVFDTLLNGPSGHFGRRDWSFVVSNTRHGPVMGYYRQLPDIDFSGEEMWLPDKTICFTETENGYLYEWHLPWQRIAPISPWILGRCGFSYTLNDNDGGHGFDNEGHGFKGSLAWTEGVVFGQNSGGLGQIIFDGAVGTRDAVFEIPPDAGNRQPDTFSQWSIKGAPDMHQTAGFVLHTTKERNVTGFIKVFIAGMDQPYATGRIDKTLQPGDTAAFTWKLLSLPSGLYEIEFQNSLADPADWTPQRWPYRQFESPLEPAAHPLWIDGYRVRYLLRVIGDLRQENPKTVIARIPTGGWLKDDVSDLVVTTTAGKSIPLFVLSHDRSGDTIIQFRRQGEDSWYWLYAVNPDAPARNLDWHTRLGHMKEDAQAAARAQMKPLMVSGKRAAELRNITRAIERQRSTIASANEELASWQTLLPQRTAAAESAAEKLPPVQLLAEQAAQAHASFQASANQATAQARAASREATATRSAAQKADTAYREIRKTGQRTERARAAKQRAALLAKQKQVIADAASKRAQDARLAAAPTATSKAKVDQQLAELSARSAATEAAAGQARQRIADATKLRTNAEKSIVELTPKLAPAQEAAKQAKAIADPLVADAAGKAQAYEALARDVDPDLLQEGLIVEFRNWRGDQLDSWPSVLASLQSSKNLLGSAIVGQLVQNVNPFRRSDPRNFAASYRGYLKIDRPGIYSFFVNGDDTTFLFINGYKVYSRTGSNLPIGGRVGVYSIGTDIQLETGAHPFEIHHIVGNTPTATGKCAFYWLPPGSRNWSFTTPAAFATSLQAVPVSVQAHDGRQLAVFEFAMDDTLTADGVTLYLARFVAQGSVKEPDELTWKFSDGSTANGRNIWRVYFAPGDREISLKSHPELPPFRRRISVWTPPIPTNAHSLERAVFILSSMDLTKLSRSNLNEIYHFLRICEQPTRWSLMEKLCRLLLDRDDLDVRYRAMLHTSLMRAMSHQGRAAEALGGLEHALSHAQQVKSLTALVLLSAANVNRDALRNFREADRLYARVLHENARLRHPIVRRAAVAWGDMFLQADDMVHAGEAYRLAIALGNISGDGRPQGNPIKRGAMLRVAEQQLKQGNNRQTRRLLQRIETEFPDQKLEGLYRFLRGEAERHAGRYQQAVGHYEILLQLRQWSGYRANAIFGLADSYYRMGDYDRALKWLEDLQQSFPDFFGRQNLGAYQSNVAIRDQHLQSGQGASLALFTRLDIDLDNHTVAPYGAGVLPTLGFGGNHAVFLHEFSSENARFAPIPLKNLPPQGALRVELWYRDRAVSAGSVPSRRFEIEVQSATGKVIGHAILAPQRTFGRWHKAAFNLPMPKTDTGSIIVRARNTVGLLEVAALTVLHVSDRQNDALRNFLEGADPQ